MVFTGSVEIDLNCDMGEPLNDLCLKPRPTTSGMLEFDQLPCLVLTLGEGDETALQSRRRTSQNATSKDVSAKERQCANGERSRRSRSRPGCGDGADRPRARSGVGTAV